MSRHPVYSLTLLACTLLTGCAPSYYWANSDFPQAEWDRQLTLDKGKCMFEAERSYPDPYPVRDPDEMYRECMAETSGYIRVPVRTADGEIEYRTVYSRGDQYYCRVSRDQRDAFRDYQDTLRRQQFNRIKYTDACLEMLGWERIPLE